MYASQQHSSPSPRRFAAKEERYSHRVDEGEVSELPVQPGDLVLATTDGLLDNLWMPDVQVWGRIEVMQVG
jgi:hypothetical protein